MKMAGKNWEGMRGTTVPSASLSGQALTAVTEERRDRVRPPLFENLDSANDGQRHALALRGIDDADDKENQWPQINQPQECKK